MAVFGGFTQSVSAGGQLLRVHDLAISESADNRTTDISFAIDRDSNTEAAYDAVQAGTTMQVVQTVDGEAFSRIATILTVENKRYRTSSLKSVRAVGESYDLQRIRFEQRWENVGATDLVQEALTDHAPNFGQSLQQNSTIIEEYESAYDTVYDLLQEVCRLTSWAWRIESGVVYFFDPATQDSGTIEQFPDVEAGTLDVSQSLDGVYNIALTTAYTFRNVTAQRQLDAGDCIRELYIDQKWRDWELVNSLFLREDSDITASMGDDGVVRLDKEIQVTRDQTVHVDLVFKRLVWVESFDQPSIDQYGPLYAPPIGGNGGQTVRSAKQKLNAFIDEHRQPTIDASASLTRAGITPDSLVQVELMDPPVSRLLYVESVTRTTNQTELDVQVSLVTPETGAAALAIRRNDPAVVMEKRITKLERKDVQQNSASGNFANLVGPIAAAPLIADSITWEEVSFVTVSFLVQDSISWSESNSVISKFAVSDSLSWSEESDVYPKPVVQDSLQWTEQTITEFLGQEFSAAREVTLAIPDGFTVERGLTADGDVTITVSMGVTIDGPEGITVERGVSGFDELQGVTVQREVTSMPGITVEQGITINSITTENEVTL